MKVLTAYNTANDRWLLKADSWYRELDEFCGTMRECIERIGEVISGKPSPYDAVLKEQLYDREEQMCNPLKVEVSPQGIYVNDWFGI